MSSKKAWEWGNNERILFQEIKAKFIERVQLVHPDWNKPLYLSTDASKISISAILYQINDNGEEQVITFAGRTLLQTERNYSITELEFLAIVYACKKLRIYLIGHFKTIVRTDHKALSFLKSCKLTYGRLFRWSLILQEYNLKIQFISGKENIAADILSRVTDKDFVNMNEENSLKVYKTDLKLGVTNKEIVSVFKDLSLKQQQDPKYSKIK